MPLPRKKNIDQLKRLRKKMGKDIGDLSISKKNNRSMNNLNWTDNPLDRKIDTYEGFIKNGRKNKKTKSIVKENLNMDENAFVIWENYLMENEDFVKENYEDRELIINDILDKYGYKEGIEEMTDEFFMYLDEYLEGELTYSTNESVYNRGVGPGNFELFKNNIKDKPSSRVSTDIFKVGKYIQVGNLEGFIDSVDEDFVYISKLPGVGEIEKVSYKDLMKKIKFSKVNENSGLPSELWTEEVVDEDDYIDDYDENDENDDINYSNQVETETEEEIQTDLDDDEIQIDLDNNYINDYDENDDYFGTEDNPRKLKF